MLGGKVSNRSGGRSLKRRISKKKTRSKSKEPIGKKKRSKSTHKENRSMRRPIKSGISRGKVAHGKSKCKKKNQQGKQGKQEKSTLLYNEGLQYYKDFLKSIHSVKSVSQYFEDQQQ